MPPATHLVSGRVPGYGPLDGRCFPCSGVSGRALNVSPCSSRGEFASFQQVKVVSLRYSSRGIMSSVCNAYPNGQRRNGYSKQNSRGFSKNKNWHDEDLDSADSLEDSEILSLNNGSPSLHGSSSPKSQATATPGPNERKVVELFKQIQAKIIQNRALKEGKKVDGSLEPMEGEAVEGSQSANKPKEGVDDLLEVLRQHSVQHGKKSSSSRSSSSGSRGFILDQPEKDSSFVGDRSPNFLDAVRKVKNDVPDKDVPSVSRPATKFRRRSPVPKPKTHSMSGSFGSGAFTEIEMKRKVNKSDPVTKPEYLPKSEHDLEMETESESEDELEVENASFLTNGAVFDEYLGDETTEIEDIADESDDDLKENLIEDNDLIGMKMAELKALAKSRGMKGYSKLKKHELLELLTSSGQV